MFLLVNNFKMIGMLLNVVHGQVQTYNKEFPNHYTSINFVCYKWKLLCSFSVLIADAAAHLCPLTVSAFTV